MHELTRCSLVLCIVLFLATTSVADPALVHDNGLDAEIRVQDQASGITQSTSVRGDLNLDGIPFTIADWMMVGVLFSGCTVDLSEVLEQAYVTCTGEPTFNDLSRIFSVLMGVEPPFDCSTGGTLDADRPARPESIASGIYAVEIRDQLIAGVETGWIEVVLLEAPEVMTGFQFNIEYDSDRLEFVDFVDGMLGDHFAHHARMNEVILEPGKSCLRIAGQSCGIGENCPSPLTLPNLPATLMRLKFRVRTLDEDFATELDFAWDYCHDNGISVGPEEEDCGWWPDYLAVSKNVYNASGDDITASDNRYGGAGEDCMVGGSRDIPIRQIDFHSGTLTYQPDCCQGRVGDANGIDGDEPTIGDVSILIDVKFISGDWRNLIDCLAEADINLSGGCNPTFEDISIGDIAILIDYLFITGPPLGLPDCLDCP